MVLIHKTLKYRLSLPTPNLNLQVRKEFNTFKQANFFTRSPAMYFPLKKAYEIYTKIFKNINGKKTKASLHFPNQKRRWEPVNTQFGKDGREKARSILKKRPKTLVLGEEKIKE